MSKYQYYEFQAVDRPLSEADCKALRALSSRARITSTSFTNHYEWGDFKGDPKKLMERCFDLHLYLANWGTRRLMIRLPKRLVDRSLLDACLTELDWVEVSTAGENLVVDIYRDEVDLDDLEWDGGDGWLATLAPLRADVMSGDLRLFYLLWLAAVEEDGVDDDAAEPLPGIGPLTESLEAFAAFFGTDPELVAAAAERSLDPGDAATSRKAVQQAVTAIPEPEKAELLLRLVEGDPHVAAELRCRVRRLGVQPAPGLRTAGELRARRAALREARERAELRRQEAERARQAAEAEKARRARLDALTRRGEAAAWRTVEAEIERRNPAGYQAAVGLLCDLRDLAAERGILADFTVRLSAIRERHARKGKFIERLNGITPE
jgi:hypothetical protein